MVEGDEIMEVKLNKLVIVLAVVLAVSLSACSLVDNYLPQQNESLNLSLNDSFDVVEDGNESVSTNTSQETNASTDDQDEVLFSTRTVVEGDLVSLRDISARDPDGDEVSYEYKDPFNEKGLWQTNEGDAGKYLTTVVATDGMLSTTEEIQIIVKPSNKAPLIECEESYEFSEGDLIDLPCVIYDKEGDDFNFTVSGFMDDLTYQSTYQDAGNHTVVISATDGDKVRTKEIDVIIENTNRAPELIADLEPINATELETIELDLQVQDPDGDELEITYPEPFDQEGVWTPQRGQAGTYELEVEVSDGEKTIVVPFVAKINKVNLPPVFEPVEPITVHEGETITLNVNVTDDEEVILSYEGFMDGRRYTTTYDDAGEHQVIVTASDGVHQVQEVINITVLNVNRPPEFIDTQE